MNNKTEINIEFPFDSGGSVSGCVSVTPLGDDLYKLEETPLVDYAAFGDVIEVEEIDNGCFVFKRIAEKSKYKCHELVLAKSLIESENFEKIVKRVEKEGGQWEIIFGGMVLINLPLDSCFDVAQEIQNMKA